MTHPSGSSACRAADDGHMLARLLRPRSIAILGASPERTSVGGGVLANLEDFGYDGEIHLVSRSRDSINGRACVKSVNDLPMGIDVAVLIVPFAAIRESVVACIGRGVGAIVIYTSGFAEASDEGRRQQEELADLCRAAGVALLGPNCMGYTNYVDGIPLTFEPVEKKGAGEGARVAIVAQSGATAANIRFAMQARKIPIAHVVATGNEALLSAEDFIDYSINDPQITAVAVYVEQLRDPARFLAVARAARAKGKPIVMLHPGSSERGRKAAESHTGALAGDHAVMQAAARNEAVVIVDTLDEMFDVLAILVRFPVPKPGRAGIVTNSGAIRGLAFDFCEHVGLELARLSPEVEAELRAQVPDYVHVDNPFDVGTTGFSNPGIFGTSAASMLKDPEVGMILSAHAGGSAPMQVKKSDYLLPVYRTAEKPIIFTIIGDDYPLDPQFMRDVRGSGIPFFRSPERAIRAMKVVSDYADALAAVKDRSTEAAAQLDLPSGGALAEHAGKRILVDLGIRCPKGELVQDIEAALNVAARIGFPVVIKAQAPDLSHKSDAGAVLINLRDEAELRAGWDQLHANLAKAAPGLALDGVLVEEMAPQGLELVVGARRDPGWGSVLLVGLGGVWIEVLKDSRLLPADISHARAMSEIHKLKAARLLGPFRGQPARDVAAVADVVVKLGALMRANPQIAEVDINPLLVFAEGKGVVALDALFVTEGGRAAVGGGGMNQSYGELNLFIDGEWLGAGGRNAEDVINPATGEAIGSLPHATPADLDRASAAAARAFADWRKVPAYDRAKILRKAADLLRERAQGIARRMTMEQGKPLAEALQEVFISADIFDYTADEGRRVYGRIVPSRVPGVRWMVTKEPVGPVAAFTPWNFPAVIPARKISAALATGCTMVIKPSEETPASVLELARALDDAGLPKGVLNVVYGVPAEVSEHLIAAEEIRKITFTGSTAVGQHLAVLAAKAGVKRATMELGGHAPVLIFDDADVDAAIAVMAGAKYRNAGQVCVSPTRFFVQESVHDRFVDGFTKAAAAIRTGNGLEEGVTMGPLANDRRVAAMDRLIADAVSHGAELRQGGEALGNRGNFFAPTVLAHVPDTARIMNEEPFGPIAVTSSFVSFDEVIARANRLPFGLAAYAFTSSATTAAKLADALEAGMVGINNTFINMPETPFGGVKQSGYGSEGGIEGMEAYLVTKTVSQS